MDLNIPLNGPTYTNRSLAAGAQHTQNFYLELNPLGNEQSVLMPFPGCKAFGTAGNGKGRGMFEHNGVAYTVSGTELYSVASNGSTTLIGTIVGTNRVGLESDGTNLVITNGSSKPYQYNGTTLSQGTDTDLPDANTVTYLNDRVIYDRDAGLAFADLNDPLTVNSANVLNTNTTAAGCVGVIAKGQLVHAFCSDSIEPSYFVQTGTPPYSRANNAVEEGVGSDAPYSIAKNKDFIYFLGVDRVPYQRSGTTSRSIGNPAIGQEIEKYTKTDDAYGICFNFDAQFFYLLTFPTAQATWLYNQNSGLWTSLTFYPDSGAHLMAGYCYCYGKHLVSDRRNGSIYELDFDTFTDDGEIIQRIRTTRSISSKDFGAPGRELFMNSLKLVIEPGVSLVSEASDLIMEYSDDNGKTWSSQRFHSIGEQGDFTWVIEWFGLGSFYKRIFRFTMTDAVKWVLVSLDADIEVGLL